MCTGGDRLMMVAVEIVRETARVPAGIDCLDVLVDSVPVGDLLVRVCAQCHLGVIEHVRIDPPYRWRGLGRRLVAAATEDHRGYRWSTTVIADNPGAQAFAAAGIWPGPPCPRWCSHMRDADALMP